MKKIITSLFVIFISTNLFAQAPSKMSYQAVVRGNTGQLIAAAPIGMRITILQGSPNGTPVYSETQSIYSNDNGLVSLAIGSGNVTSGNFTAIDWSDGPYFIKSETDLSGGTNYTVTGTSQLMSVPFAMYAETSGSGTTSVNGVTPVSGNITLVKSDIGLGNVDNTSDLNKPVSTATQTALDLKADITSPDFAGTPTVPTATLGTNTMQIASTEFVMTAVAAGSTPDATASIKGRIALGGDIAGTGSTAEAPVITSNAVTTAKIADLNVTTDKIADANITSDKIADASVTYSKIQEVSATGKILGRTSPGNGVVEELSVTGTGDVALSDSPVFTGTPTAPTATTGDNSDNISTTAFVKAEISAAEIKETPSGWPVTLQDSHAGKIVTTQWGGWPVIPENLSNGFSCTIINYSNATFTSNTLTTAFFFTQASGWNNGNGLTSISIKSGGTIRLNVIDVNGVKGYFVTGDIL